MECPLMDDNGIPMDKEPNNVKPVKDELPDCFVYMKDVLCGNKLCRTYKETLDNHF